MDPALASDHDYIWASIGPYFLFSRTFPKHQNHHPLSKPGLVARHSNEVSMTNPSSNSGSLPTRADFLSNGLVQVTNPTDYQPHCTICNEDFTDAVHPGCFSGHVACRACITEWFNTGNTCHICRTALFQQPAVASNPNSEIQPRRRLNAFAFEYDSDGYDGDDESEYTNVLTVRPGLRLLPRARYFADANVTQLASDSDVVYIGGNGDSGDDDLESWNFSLM